MFVLDCVGDIEGTTRVTNAVVTQKIIVTWGSCAYMYNNLPPPIHDHLARHPEIFGCSHCFAVNIV